MTSFWSKYGVSAVALVLIGFAFFAGIRVGEMSDSRTEQVAGVLNINGDPLTLNVSTNETVDFAPFWRVWNILNKKYVPRGTSTSEIADPQEKVWNAISGLVDTYDDPYTVFFPPAETEQFKESATGSFEGVGMVVGVNNDGRLFVIAPLEDSPAMKAGFLPGDLIKQIDEVDATSISIEEGVALIRGPRNSEVVVIVERDGKSIEITVTRGNIDIPSTSSGIVSREIKKPLNTKTIVTKTITNNETGEIEIVEVPVNELPDEAVEIVEQDFFVLRLFSFSESSVRGFKRGLEDFTKSGTNNLIIDLRGNPGGFLQSAVDIASYFLPKDEVVVREIFGADKKEQVQLSLGYDLLADLEDSLELVILIDKRSASASEILAGALREYGVATLVGEKSFGKGSVQELIDITEDISLKVTTARWYTPSGVSISGEGLTPDIEVDLGNSSPFTDLILDAAIDFLANKK